MARNIDPPWWWKPWLHLYFVHDWWYRGRPVRIWRGTLGGPDPDTRA